MTNIYKFTGETRNDINPDDVLDGAKGQCENVLIVGNDSEGNLYVAASTAKVSELLRLIETFKFKLLNGDFN